MNTPDFIPTVHVAEFPPGTLLLQSPEGWAYYLNDGRESYLTPNQQPVSNYYNVHRSAEDYILWPDGRFIPVDDLPVWEWDGTNLAAKHFRPVPTNLNPYADIGNVEAPASTSDAIIDTLMAGRDETNRHLDRIATALEGILAEHKNGNAS